MPRRAAIVPSQLNNCNYRQWELRDKDKEEKHRNWLNICSNLTCKTASRGYRKSLIRVCKYYFAIDSVHQRTLALQSESDLFAGRVTHPFRIIAFQEDDRAAARKYIYMRSYQFSRRNGKQICFSSFLFNFFLRLRERIFCSDYHHTSP